MDNNLYFEEINKERYNDTVMPKMWDILAEIMEKTKFDEQNILMLSLYGSQNYRMENDDSDIDCECLVFPTEADIIFGKPLYSTCITTSYGTCHVKDIRAAFNELYKSSPNMLEIFASPYMIINKEYSFPLTQICCHFINYFARLNPYKLMRGFDGLYAKYRKEMNTSNKAYANALRMENMMTCLLHGLDYTTELVPHNYIALKDLKYSDKIDTEMREYTENNGYSPVLRSYVDRFYDITDTDSNDGVRGTISAWEEELMVKYLKLIF